MKKEYYSYLSADDSRTRIHGVKWLPDDGRLVGVLQLIHGMGEYIERYEEFAGYMCDKGFVVMGHDHIGHGASVENENDYGIMHTRHPADIMVEDIYTNYVTIRGLYPELDHFILGHSMGSYLLRQFLVQKAARIPELKGAIIMGTGQESRSSLRMAQALLKTMIKLKGPDHKSNFAAGLMYGRPYNRFDVTGSDPSRSWLTKDEERAKKAAEDPKINMVFSLNGYGLLVHTCLFDSSKRNISKMRKDIPVLFISGSDDPVGNLGKGVRQATAMFHSAGVMDLSLKLFAGDRHEILHETDRERVYNYIYHWIKKRMSR